MPHPSGRAIHGDLRTNKVLAFPTGSPSHFFAHISPRLALSKIEVVTWCGDEKIERGDLLVIEHPLEQQGRLYIKRCAALPGDRFFEKDRHFYLQIEGNTTKTLQYALRYDLEAVHTKYGYFLRDPYMKYYCVAHNDRLRVPKVLETLPVQHLKKDQYYLLGDYRDNSADSRFFGAVPRQWIRSKVLFIFKKAHSWQQLIEIKEADEANATHHEADARHP